MPDDTFVCTALDSADDTFMLLSEAACARGAHPVVWVRCARPLAPGRRYLGRLKWAREDQLEIAQFILHRELAAPPSLQELMENMQERMGPPSTGADRAAMLMHHYQSQLRVAAYERATPDAH